MNAIECSNLGRSFGRVKALQNINLEVPAGSFFALLGPNGAGKTTLLKLLLNLIQPSTGSAKVLGSACVSLKAADFKRIGYVAEGQDLPEWMTVAQLLDYCRPLYPTWDNALEKRLISTFDLPVDRKIKTVSRGTRMKAALLSSLAFRPELLLLDEPFSGLDPLMRDDFIQGLLELPSDDRPRTIVVSSHDIDEVERLADQVGFISEGSLLVREPADEIRARFRRIEIVGPSIVLPAVIPPAWVAVQKPGENVLQLVHTEYKAATTTQELEAVFPSAQISARALSLREIFLVLARLERSPGKEAA